MPNGPTLACASPPQDRVECSGGSCGDPTETSTRYHLPLSFSMLVLIDLRTA